MAAQPGRLCCGGPRRPDPALRRRCRLNPHVKGARSAASGRPSTARSVNRWLGGTRRAASLSQQRCSPAGCRGLARRSAGAARRPHRRGHASLGIVGAAEPDIDGVEVGRLPLDAVGGGLRATRCGPRLVKQHGASWCFPLRITGPPMPLHSPAAPCRSGRRSRPRPDGSSGGRRSWRCSRPEASPHSRVR